MQTKSNLELACERLDRQEPMVNQARWILAWIILLAVNVFIHFVVLD